MGKGFPGQVEPEPLCRAGWPIQLLEDVTVIVWRHHHEDVLKVLGRSTNHAGTADVDFLDQSGEGRLRICRGLHKWIQIDHKDINQADLVARRRRHVFRPVPPGEDAAVNLRMKGLDAAVHHFRKTGDIRDGQHGQAGILKGPGSSPGRHQLETP